MTTSETDSQTTKSSKKKGSSEPSMVVSVRNAAVYILYRRLIGVSLVAVASALVSLVALWAVIGKPVPPQYIPVTQSGELLPPVPLDQPNTDRGGVGAFALEAVRSVNTYDYINYRDQLAAAEGYFSTAGWNSFSVEYQKSATLNAVIARKMIVSVQPTGEVRFLNEGIVSSKGTYVWQVQVPIEIQFTAHALLPNGNIDTGSRETGVVTLYISRVPTMKSPSGLAVQLYIMSLNTPNAAATAAGS